MRRSYHEYEECKAKGVAIARQVSAICRAAGVVKAGRYTPFGGYDPAGFSVSESGNGTSDVPTAVALWCGDGGAGMVERMREAVEADGRFDVIEFRHEDRVTHGSFRVVRRTVTKGGK